MSIDWYAIVDSVGDDADLEQLVTMPAASRLLLMELATAYHARYNRSGLAEPTEMYKYLSTAQKALAREEEPMDKLTVAMGTAVPLLQSLPGIVGIWPMTVTNGTYEAVDVSGNGLHLINNGVTAVKFGTYATFDNNYLSRADNTTLDIRGNWESIENPGLTMGAWARVNQNAGPSGAGIMGKDQTANQRSYGLLVNSNSTRLLALVSGNGTDLVVVGTGADSMGTGNWSFACLRYVPSTSLDLWLNGTKYTNTTSIPASLYNSTSGFNIGRYQSAYYLNGSMSMAFLSSAAVPEDLILRYYNHTRIIYDG